MDTEKIRKEIESVLAKNHPGKGWKATIEGNVLRIESACGLSDTFALQRFLLGDGINGHRIRNIGKNMLMGRRSNDFGPGGKYDDGNR